MPADPAKGAKVVMPGGKPLPSHIRFKYLIEDDYAPIYANGAHGSTTAHGELVLSFYMERTPVPLSETNNVSAEGLIVRGDKLEESGGGGELMVLRQVCTGVVMSLATAERVHALIGKLLANVKALEQEAK